MVIEFSRVCFRSAFCSSLNATHVSSTAIAELRDVAYATSASDRAWATMSVHTSVLVLIIVEPHRLGCGTRENGTSVRKDFLLLILHGLGSLFGNFLKGIEELLVVDLPACALLA